MFPAEAPAGQGLPKGHQPQVRAATGSWKTTPNTGIPLPGTERLWQAWPSHPH